MVALGLPPAAHRALELAHAALAEEAPQIVLPEEPGHGPYLPHISLIYGVDEANQPAIAASLQEQAGLHASIPLELGELLFWDLGDTGKTALVAPIADRGGHLAALHRALQPLTGRPERYPYQPHITIAYLARGKRPSADVLDRLRDHLATLHTSVAVAWITDRCGLPRGYEALLGGTRTSPPEKASPSGTGLEAPLPAQKPAG